MGTLIELVIESLVCFLKFSYFINFLTVKSLLIGTQLLRLGSLEDVFYGSIFRRKKLETMDLKF